MSPDPKSPESELSGGAHAAIWLGVVIVARSENASGSNAGRNIGWVVQAGLPLTGFGPGTLPGPGISESDLQSGSSGSGTVAVLARPDSVFAGNFPLQVFRSEFSAYRYNLSSPDPKIYIVLRERVTSSDACGIPEATVGIRSGASERPDFPSVLRLTINPDEAAGYLEGGDQDVLAAPMEAFFRMWLNRVLAQSEPVEDYVRHKRRKDDTVPERSSWGRDTRMRRPGDPYFVPGTTGTRVGDR